MFHPEGLYFRDSGCQEFENRFFAGTTVALDGVAWLIPQPGFQVVCVLLHHGVVAIEQGIHSCRRAAHSRVEGIDGPVDAAQGHVQRNAGTLPGGDETPVHWRDEQVLTAPPDKMLLDLGEVVVIVHFTRSYTSLIPSRVRFLSTESISSHAGEINSARPPVETTYGFSSSSFI